MNSKKIKAIRNWPTSNNLKSTQSFLGFCNFYRHFIYCFFNLAKPLSKLTKKDQPFEWNPECQDSFESLKDALFKAPILAHFDPNRKTILKTDASQYITGGVLSQYSDNGSLHPVTFYSKNMLPAECNYHIYDKELLTIIKCLKNWRSELEMTHNPFEVLTDNQALKHFKTAQKLSPWQCCYLNLISDFDFHIKYHFKKANVRADVFIRMSDCISGDEDEKIQECYQVLLSLKQFQVTALEGEESMQQGTPGECNFYEWVKEVNWVDKELEQIKRRCVEQPEEWCDTVPEEAVVQDSILYKDYHLWVSESMITELLWLTHNEPPSNHQGQDWTKSQIESYYYWPTLYHNIDHYTFNCMICKHAKTSQQKLTGLLHPLEIPQKHWQNLSCNFITGLPESEGMNAILTIVDRLSKEQYYIPCCTGDKWTSLKETAWLFIHEVFYYHGLPQSIVSDQGPQFISRMWKSLLKQLGINPLISISHHPETDGQTEHFNQEVKIRLCLYMNHLQDNWVCWLPIVEFADNNAVNKSTKMTPFYFNKGFSPCMSFSSDTTKADTVQKKLQICSATEIARTMNMILLIAHDNLTKAQSDMVRQANCQHCVEDFVVEDEVMINIWNFVSDQPTKALDDKKCGPFRILQQFHFFYKLDIPPKWYIMDTFHASDLTRAADPKWPPFTGQRNPLPELAVINNKNQAEWVLDEILNSQYSGPGCCFQYKIHWFDCDPDSTWYNTDSNEF